MKKSLILIVGLFVLTASGIFAATYDASKHGTIYLPKPDCKAVYIEKNPYASTDYQTEYWLLQGFDLANYNPDTDPDLSSLVDNEIAKISAINKQKGIKEYVVVGHSQGGPRSLAYATKLKQQKSTDEYKQLKGVITISGVDRGIKALEGGFGQLKVKMTSDLDTFFKGINGSLYSLSSVTVKNLIYVAINFAAEAIKEGGSQTVSNIDSFLACALEAGGTAAMNDTKATGFIMNVLTWCLSGNIGPNAARYVSRGWQGLPYDYNKQVYDMMPSSNFISTYVCDTKRNTYKVQTGTETKKVWTSRKWGILKIVYLTNTTVPVYKTVTKDISNTAKFDANLPVGYIVGTDSNTLGLMFNSPKVKNNLYAEERSFGGKAARFVVNACGVGFTAAEAVNVAKGSLCISATSSTGYSLAANKCRNAASLCYNIDSHLNDIKGSSENDGFVAVESQYIPKAAHTKIVGAGNGNYYSVNKNHQYTEPVYYRSPSQGADSERTPLPWKDPDHTGTNNKVVEMVKTCKTMK